jgi:DNA-binding CsgD family transcriptional regulator
VWNIAAIFLCKSAESLLTAICKVSTLRNTAQQCSSLEPGFGSPNIQAVAREHLMSTRPPRGLRAPILQPTFARAQLPAIGSVTTGSLLTEGEWQHLSELLSLSTRESEIARLILDDLAESDIAVRLSISRHTVHTYIDRLYRKLHVHSRHQLLLQVFNAHLSHCHSRCGS